MLRWLRLLAGVVLPVAIVAATLVVVCSCPRPEPITLQVLAGSELDDVIGPLEVGDGEFLRRMREETGVTLEVKFLGSLSGAESLTAARASYDLAWFASDAYLQVLARGGESPVVEQESIVWSPVVLGVKRSVAERYQWVGRAVSWRDVAQKVAEEDPRTGRGFRFAMADPAASNSGLAALVEAAVAMTGGRGEFSGSDVEEAVMPLRALFQGVGMTAGSSGWLSDQYPSEQSNLDGLVNYESEILALNETAGVEQLHVIYPSDGVVTANYPLMLLRGEADERAAYERLVCWLRGEWAQRRLAEHTRRHMLNEDAAGHQGIQVPSEKDRLDQLLVSYQDRIRKPPRATYVVDQSASMGDPQNTLTITSKLDKLKEVFRELAADDPLTAARFRRLRSREQVTILPFRGPVPQQFDHAGRIRKLRPAIDAQIREGQAGTADRAKLSAFVGGLEPGGATALFDALYEAYVRLDRELGSGTLEDYMAKWYPSIVLLTDGDRYLGMDRARFEKLWKQARSRDVRVFAVHIGPGKVAAACSEPGQLKPDEPELCQIAALTGGRVFDTSSADLLDIIREIRGYQ